MSVHTETEDEFHIRIEQEVIRLCQLNPGMDPEEMRVRIIFLERCGNLDPIEMAAHIHEQACAKIELMNSPDVTKDELQMICSQLMFGITSLMTRMEKMVEAEARVIIPTSNSVYGPN